MYKNNRDHRFTCEELAAQLIMSLCCLPGFGSMDSGKKFGVFQVPESSNRVSQSCREVWKSEAH